MKKISIAIVAGLLISGSSFPQMGGAKMEDLKKIQSRTLLVVLEEPEKKLLDKLNPEEQANYQKDIADYNVNIKSAIAHCWKFTEQVEYRNRSEVIMLIKSKDKKSAYLESSKYKENFATPATFRATFNRKDIKDKPNLAMPMGDIYKVSELDIRLCDDNPLSPPVYGQFMLNVFPNKADLVYALKQIQIYFGYRLKDMSYGAVLKEANKNGAKLPSLTLLIDEQDTELKNDEIKKVYPYPFELVKKEKIDEAILNADSKYAFAAVIPSGADSYLFEVYDAAEELELARSAPDQNTGISFGGGLLDEVKDLTKNKLKKDHFKIFGKFAKKLSKID